MSKIRISKYNGRRVSEMTRDDLIDALTDAAHRNKTMQDRNLLLEDMISDLSREKKSSHFDTSIKDHIFNKSRFH